MTRISSRGAWLRDLWATLAGLPHSPVASQDVIRLKQLEIAPDEQLIAYFEQYPAPLTADGFDLALGVLRVGGDADVQRDVFGCDRLGWYPVGHGVLVHAGISEGLRSGRRD